MLHDRVTCHNDHKKVQRLSANFLGSLFADLCFFFRGLILNFFLFLNLLFRLRLFISFSLFLEELNLIFPHLNSFDDPLFNELLCPSMFVLYLQESFFILFSKITKPHLPLNLNQVLHQIRILIFGELRILTSNLNESELYVLHPLSCLLNH